LSGFQIELILYMMAATGRDYVKKAVSLYITRLRYVTIEIRGADLKAMGLAPGPLYREILQAVKDARLNGALKNKSQELRYARQYAQQVAEPADRQTAGPGNPY
jgi:tRNA nucleotidyltransferase (CCA-adding enzyme)